MVEVPLKYQANQSIGSLPKYCLKMPSTDFSTICMHYFTLSEHFIWI